MLDDNERMKSNSLDIPATDGHGFTRLRILQNMIMVRGVYISGAYLRKAGELKCVVCCVTRDRIWIN